MHESKQNALKEYNDLKFGMFIHWGVYSKLGGVWKGVKIVPEKFGPQATIGEWIMHSAKIPRNEYCSVAKTFNPAQFDADLWVKLAKDAGMKYIIAMTKHHDGFSMYHSDVSDYNVYDYTEFKRDPIAEIYKACKKYGLRLGLYYSHSIDWMDGGDAGIAQAKMLDPQHDDADQGNSWDPSPVSFDDYLEHKAKPQVKEILTKFPDLLKIWFDYPSYMNLQQSFDFCKLGYDYQPQCLINSRVGNDLGDVLTAGDNEIPNDINGNYSFWETPGTLNNTWGYKSYDHDWKSLNEMLFWIVEIASKGGNYLLNIGPDGNGAVPEASQKILKQIGVWMKQNGEAIYGTTRWTTMKEGPTSLVMKGTGERRKKGFNTTFTHKDFWFTAKDKNIYIISLASSTGDKIRVSSLFSCFKNIKSISRLEDGKILAWKVAGNKVEIVNPVASKKTLQGFVLKVELK
ncbi:MAG: alpha-L-fucosidase [Chitinophagaceae bacterium]|nr:alpha-L-fucosidase [Chitinophagaceae bacterium]